MSVSESFMRAPEVGRTLPLRPHTDNGWITQSDYPTGRPARAKAQVKTAGPVRHHPSMTVPPTKAVKPAFPRGVISMSLQRSAP